MKKIVFILSIILLIATIITCGHFYRKPMIIEAVDDYATAVDADGNIWAFGPDNYEIGDTVSLMLFDNFTSSIYDDVIIDTGIDMSVLVYILCFITVVISLAGFTNEVKRL